MSGAGVEAHQVRIIREDVDTRMPDGDAAAMMLRSVVDQSFADRPRIVPYAAAGASVHRVHIVRRADKKNPVDCYRCNLKVTRGPHVKGPLRAQLADVSGVNLTQARVAASGIVAIVRRPISTWRRHAKIFRRNIYNC